jgi:amino acid permease
MNTYYYYILLYYYNEYYFIIIIIIILLLGMFLYYERPFVLHWKRSDHRNFFHEILKSMPIFV